MSPETKAKKPPIQRLREWFNRIWPNAPSKWTYAWQTRRSQISCGGLALAAVCLIIWLPFPSSPKWPHTCWWNWAEPIVGITTLATALAVWWGEVGQDWENNLEKRLNVTFQYQGKDRLVCTGLRLTGENDIRALSQQIGRQMNSNNDLKFDLFIKQESKIITPRNKKKFNDFKLYIVKPESVNIHQ